MLSCFFKIESGVRQGSSILPTLFILIINFMIVQLRSSSEVLYINKMFVGCKCKWTKICSIVVTSLVFIWNVSLIVTNVQMLILDLVLGVYSQTLNLELTLLHGLHH